MSNDIYITHMIIDIFWCIIIVCLTCNITLPRRRGSRPDGARYSSGFDKLMAQHWPKELLIWHSTVLSGPVAQLIMITFPCTTRLFKRLCMYYNSLVI